MKKIGLLILTLLILNIFAIQAADLVNVNPENSDSTTTIAGINPENIGDLADNPIKTVNDSVNYLRQEQIKILEKYAFGRFILGIGDFLKSLNFLWLKIFGIEFSLSLIFAFAIAIWLMLFYAIYWTITDISNKKMYGFIGAFLITAIISNTGVIKKAVDALAFTIKNIWLAGISLVLAVLIIFLINKVGKSFNEEEEEEKLEQAKKAIKTQGKVAEKELETYSNGAGI